MATSLQDVIDQMTEFGIAGLQASDLVVDGAKHAFKPSGKKKKSGWYILHEHLTRSGKVVVTGAFGMGDQDNWTKVRPSDTSLTTEERAELARKERERERAAAEARKSEAEKAAEKAAKLWARASESGTSEYLDKKGVRAFGLRFLKGTVLVPVRDAEGRLWGCQYVTTEFKTFNTDMAKIGRFHLVGEVRAGGRLLFGEGYATCASLHMATGWPVVVCFDAGNMEAVAAILRPLHPDVQFVFCGDDDRHLKARLKRRLQDMEVPGAVEPDGRVLVFHQADGRELRVSAGWRDSVLSGVKEPLRSIVLTVEREGTRRELLIENTGRKAAMTCARKFAGVAVFPAFAAADVAGTDFNDMHLAEGLAVVRERIIRALDPAEGASTSDKALPGRAKDGDKGKPPDGLDALLDGLVLVYDATVTVWDGLRRKVVKPEALNFAYGAAAAVWLRHPARKMVNQEDLVFDPSGKVMEGRINMFNGLPLVADIQRPHSSLVSLLYQLCGEDDGLFDWVARWLAFPLKYPGAKLHTAMIFHGRVEGTGKTLFFSVMREIYGRYATVVTQHQLNSSYTDWISQKMFAVAEEVLTQQERKLQKGYLKHIVSNEVLQIEAKFLPVREERNHCNFVFLSNEIQPLALDEFDRRYTVSYCDRLLPKADYDAVMAEIDAGGAAGLMAWLQGLDLGDFSVATKPYDNEPRRRLITLGMPPERRFMELWRLGEYLEAPYCSCRAEDLYQAFRAYCRMSGERFIPTQTAFGGYLRAEFIGRDGVERLKPPPRVHFFESPDDAEPQYRQQTVYLIPRRDPHGNVSREHAVSLLDADVQAFQNGLWKMAGAARRVVQ